MVSPEVHLNKNEYDLYTNITDVIVPKSRIKQNIPGTPKAIYENQQNSEVLFAPHSHQIRLPYREAIIDTDENSQAFGTMQEVLHTYEDYEAISKETECEYPYGRSLWSGDDEPYITYRLYQNTVEVAVLVKDLGKNKPGKSLVKKS